MIRNNCKSPKYYSKDDSFRKFNIKLFNKNFNEQKSKKHNSFIIERKKYFSTLLIGELNENSIFDSSENDSKDDTDLSSKSLKNNDDLKKSLKCNSSQSCNKMSNIGKIEEKIEEQKRNISDDESEKINVELNKTNKNSLDKLNKLNKNNIDFSNNMKKIFNNIGNITPFKIDKNQDENKEEEEFLLKCYNKSENIRKVYYSQLLLKRVWIPLNDSQRHNNLIIFDWDDTLLPTSFLLYKNSLDREKKLNEKEQAKIKKLEILVKNLLTLSISKGDVYIITNSGEGWVEESSKNYYPNIKDILNQIEVISARKDYEQKYPENSKLWKIKSFLNLKKRINEELITNIICIGDSAFEMEAGRNLAANFIHAVIKTIKFKESPKPDELIKQLNLVLNQFNSIFISSKNLTVRVEKKKK